MCSLERIAFLFVDFHVKLVQFENTFLEVLMELGINTFGDAGLDPVTGKIVSHAERLNQLVEEIATADRVGLDVFQSVNIIEKIMLLVHLIWYSQPVQQ